MFLARNILLFKFEKSFKFKFFFYVELCLHSRSPFICNLTPQWLPRKPYFCQEIKRRIKGTKESITGSPSALDASDNFESFQKDGHGVVQH